MRKNQQGLSLVELLIGLTIGLIVLAAIGTVYVNVTNVVRQRDDQAQLNDPARSVFQLLRSDLSQSGFVDVFDLDPGTNRPLASRLFQSGNEELTNMYVRATGAGPIRTPMEQMFQGLTPIFGCDGEMNDTPNGIVAGGPPLAASCGSANPTRHTLRIAYQAIPLNPANPTRSLNNTDPTTGVGLDCLQQNPPAVPPPGVNHIVINQYFIETIGGINQLRCRGSGAAAAQTLATGIEEFALRYQVSAPAPAGAAVAAGGQQSQYISATLVQGSPQGWAGVTAVEICMVSATDTATRGPAAQGTLAVQPTRPTCQRQADGQFADNVARAAGDTRLWKRFTSVVSLRNAVYATPI